MANPFNSPGSYDNISKLNFDILIEAKQSPNTFHRNPAYPLSYYIENPAWEGIPQFILNTTPLFIQDGEVYTPYSPPETTYISNPAWNGEPQYISKPVDHTGDELYIQNPAWNGEPEFILNTTPLFIKDGENYLPYSPPETTYIENPAWNGQPQFIDKPVDYTGDELYIENPAWKGVSQYMQVPYQVLDIYYFDGNDYVPFGYTVYIINPLWEGIPRYILWDNSEPEFLPDTVILPTEVEIPILYPFMDKVQDYTDILERYGLAINNYVITYEKDNIVKIISSNAEPNFSITIKGMSFNLSDLYNAINKRDLKIQINKIRFALEEEDDIAYLNTLTMYGIGLTSKIQKDTLNAGSFVKPNNYNKNIVDVDVNMVIDYNNILTYMYNPAMIKNISIGGGTNTMRMSFFCSILK